MSKEALCEAHDRVFGRHSTTLKMYLKITSSYFWPRVYEDIQQHIQTYLKCQQRKNRWIKSTLLAHFPITEHLNWRIRADLFSPMLTARIKQIILCLTDAFTKYATVIAILNKNAKTVANVIHKEWFCKLGIPAQIHVDGGKEFANKLSVELFKLLNVSLTKSSQAHLQCNAAVEVFN